jgi:TrmH family RNA methyltransferase
MLSIRLRKEISQLAGRQGRKKSAFFLVEGVRCCLEAARRRPEWFECLVFEPSFREHAAFAELTAILAAHGIVGIEVDSLLFATLTATENPQGVLCLLRKPAAVEIKLPRPFCLLLDQVSEPGNVGTILRTAWAVGLDSVWLTSGSADAFAPKVIRAGMGAQLALQIQVFASMEAALDTFRGLGGDRVWCSMPGTGCSIFSPEFDLRNSALVIGSESDGISRPELGQAVTIPMPGQAESLNAAQAATIFLVDAVRRGICEK